MTPRERYIETLTFGSPDRIPFCPGNPRESTLAAWRRQGLPEGVDWADHLRDVLDIEHHEARPPADLAVDFRMIPQFEEEVLAHKDGHYVVRDWKGNVCEISDDYDVTYLRQAKDFVTRRWIRCPVTGRDDWERMKARYDVNTPGRFPADFERRCRRAGKRDHLLGVGFAGPFWQMREWCGFEGLCIMMAEQPEFVDEMAEFHKNFVAELLGRIFAAVAPDFIHVSEDMAYKAKAMISPEMCRRFCKPSWDLWARLAASAGVPLIDVDSDGFVGELIPIWIESGMNVCDPVEVAAGNDINEYRAAFGRRMAYRMGVDKRAIAAGGKAIRDELERLAPAIKAGGFIPGCDHGVPADVSWPNFVDYCRMLAQMTGWL